MACRMPAIGYTHVLGNLDENDTAFMVRVATNKNFAE